MQYIPNAPVKVIIVTDAGVTSQNIDENAVSLSCS